MRSSRLLIASLALGSALTTALLAATGGPDGGGYTFVDTDESEGPTFVVLYINGDNLGLGDEDTAMVALPFTF